MFFAEIGERAGLARYQYPDRLGLLRKWFKLERPQQKNPEIAHHILSYYAKQSKIERKEIEEVLRAYVYARSNPVPDERNESLLLESGDRLLSFIRTFGPAIDGDSALKKDLCRTS